MGEKIDIDVITLLRASVLRACGRQHADRVEVPPHAMGIPNAGAVLRAEMALTVVRQGVDVSGDVTDYVTLTWPSQQPMSSQDRVDVLETVIGYTVDRLFLPECATMLREIGFAFTLTCSIARFTANNLHAWCT